VTNSSVGITANENVKASMRFIDRKHRQAPAVIIISLIDVLIVMLIFMMVTTTFKQQPLLNLALPESKQPRKGASENNLIVEIDAKEPYFRVAARPVTADQLQAIFLSAVKTNPLVRVAIRPDKNAPMGTFVKVWDAATAAGIHGQVSIYVSQPGE
jgi:biopolymer transport protein ExbD